MKLLSIIVPTYNTEDYLPRCIDSLVQSKQRDLIEIIIVIDGSPDNSLTIAQKYESLYPQIINVINKPNGGHGSTINKGLELATGKYLRVLDSDDWFDTILFDIYLEKLKSLDVDFVMSPHQIFYEKDSRYEIEPIESSLKVDTILDINSTNFTDLIGFKFIKMAGVTYKTSVLRRSKLILPEKAYYVDSIYVLCTIHELSKYIILTEPVYIYYIGREGQSMNFANIKKNVNSLIVYAQFISKYQSEYSDKFSLNVAWYVEHEVSNRLIGILNLMRRTRCEYVLRKELRKYVQKMSPTIWKNIRNNECIEEFKQIGRIILRR